MTVSAVNNTAAAPAASSAAPANPPPNAMSVTENRFLALLVAQMKNQDPLNPLDNAQVTSQMAQLSTVQGVNQTNAQLTQLLAEFQGLQALTLAGRSVLVPGSSLTLAAPSAGAAPEAKGGVQLGADATSVTVQVKDAAGKVVRTIDLGSRQAGVASFKWDGLDGNGKALAAGTYSFSVAATSNGQPVDAQALQAAKVEGVNRSAGGIQLDLGANGLVNYADILQVL
jgi:flagellar basal-body rod modification protein FlgD